MRKTATPNGPEPSAPADRNRGALRVQMAAFVDAYGLERITEALARVCDRDEAWSRGLPRARVLRRMARMLRDLGADAREYLDEGLARTTKRVIGRRTTIMPEARAIRAHGPRVAFVIVTAVRKSGIRRVHAPRHVTAEAVAAADGVTEYDLVEFDAYGGDGAHLYTDALPATALKCFANMRTA